MFTVCRRPIPWQRQYDSRAGIWPFGWIHAVRDELLWCTPVESGAAAISVAMAVQDRVEEENRLGFGRQTDAVLAPTTAPERHSMALRASLATTLANAAVLSGDFVDRT